MGLADDFGESFTIRFGVVRGSAATTTSRFMLTPLLHA
jgi:hypothetical protein